MVSTPLNVKVKIFSFPKLKKMLHSSISNAKIKANLFQINKQLNHAFFHDKKPNHPAELVTGRYVPSAKTRRAKSGKCIFDYREATKRNTPYQFKFLFDDYGQALPNTPRGASGFEELAAALKNNPVITLIDTVSDDATTKMYDERDAKVLMKAFRTLPNLRTLILGKCKLGNEAFHHLCEILKNNNPALTRLTIQSADVCNNKGRLLGLYDAVKTNTSLRNIFIAHPGLFESQNIQTTSTSNTTVTTKTPNKTANTKSNVKTSVSTESDPEEIIQAIYALVENRREPTPLVRQSLITSDSSTTSGSGQNEVAELRSQVANLTQQVTHLTSLLNQALNNQSSNPASVNPSFLPKD